MVVTLLPLLVAQAGTIQLTVDVNNVIGPISPYIYGTNQPDWNGITKNLTMTRWGGNRTTAYNWETNASNAGVDWLNQNDDFLGGGTIPLEAVRRVVVPAYNVGAAALVTVPMVGYVAADKNGGGDVNQTPDYIHVRFNQSLPKKPTAMTAIPDLTDKKVYQDEFVFALQRKLGATHPPLWFALDNEPDLWASSHPRIHPDKLTYAEMSATSHTYAKRLKSVAPNSLIFGPASYGWNGYTTLQEAPDAAGRDFLSYYLADFKKSDKATGKRTLDVLDLHYYSEAQGAGKRVTEEGTEAALRAARIQAPRSWFDPTYTEDSWISQWSTGGPLKVIPRMMEKINTNYPGTKLAFSEWSFGGGGDISGAIAAADTLGIFGQTGVFAAAMWNIRSDERFNYAGFAMYRNFDDAGGTFGDSALATTNPALDKVSVYGAKDAAGVITVVLINKATTTTRINMKLPGVTAVSSIKAYRLLQTLPKPKVATAPSFSSGAINTPLPPLSITTLQITR